MELNVGRKYSFKIRPGRGRPFIGEVMSISDDLVTLKYRGSEMVTISQKQVIRPYEFKPYNKKAKSE